MENKPTSAIRNGIKKLPSDEELKKASMIYGIEMLKNLHPNAQPSEFGVEETPELIKIKKAAKRYLSKAEKSHLEAAMYLRAGNEQKAALSAAAAHEYQSKASEVYRKGIQSNMSDNAMNENSNLENIEIPN